MESISDLGMRIAPERVEEQTEVIKHGELFLVTLPDGSVPGGYPGGLGLYFRDTRFLDCLEFYVENQKPMLLSSGVRYSNFYQGDLTNPELRLLSGEILPLQTLHFRFLRLIEDAVYQRFRVVNFALSPVRVNLSFKLGADYRDIFEIRGMTRARRGRFLPPICNSGEVVLRYEGLDGLMRHTRIVWQPLSGDITFDDNRLTINYLFELPPKGRLYLFWKITPFVGQGPAAVESGNRQEFKELFVQTAWRQKKDYVQWYQSCTGFTSDQPQFNQMLTQALSDLRVLYTQYPEGWLVEAGVPWYATMFGRDALITARQILAVNPDICRKTLQLLAAYQGKKVDPAREEQPGKIIHEIRRGEMANCGEILHTPYYGSVDSTLWFIIVLGDFISWTNDLSLLEEMREPLLKALAWCTDYGDIDGDGYIEYAGHVSGGLVHQGWKDSWDGVPDPEGEQVKPPVALVEVQAYLYGAYRRAVRLLKLLGEKEAAQVYAEKARVLRENFRRDFWVKEGGYLGVALDGAKRLVPTVASNMGHALFTGILPPQAAKQVAYMLLAPDMFSRWGIRTLSRREAAYNPMSYHNGSVWPHDNAIIAAGFRYCGLLAELEGLASAIFEAALQFPYYRLPEVFCGFDRRPFTAPVRYPVACKPQAWAAGSVFHLLRACLGMEAVSGGVAIRKPLLPAGVQRLRIKGLKVSAGEVTIDFEKRGDLVVCIPVERKGDVRALIET